MVLCFIICYWHPVHFSNNWSCVFVHSFHSGKHLTNHRLHHQTKKKNHNFQGGETSSCGLPKFFISINLILCFIVSIVSILPQVQESLPNSGLLQSAVVTLYTMYLTWSAVANNPNRECNPGFMSIIDGNKENKVELMVSIFCKHLN